MDTGAWRTFFGGILSYLPGSKPLWFRRPLPTQSARYCYSIWLRHLALAYECGLAAPPGHVAELGPGASLGVGLAALLSGAKRYSALDVVAHADLSCNTKLLCELAMFFERREPIPPAEEFPSLYPRLESYAFPVHILGDDLLDETLASERVESIGDSLKARKRAETFAPYVTYHVPWQASSVIEPDSVDMLLSQAVMEHVEDVREAYSAMYQWLRPGGIMSHEIDLTAHRTAREWYGHWCYSTRVWRLMLGRRDYLLNRLPCSAHLEAIKDAGFYISMVRRKRADREAPRDDLAPEFAEMPDEDTVTKGLFVIAAKPI